MRGPTGIFWSSLTPFLRQFDPPPAVAGAGTGFAIGDQAVWQKSDEDVPEGTVGTVRRGARAHVTVDRFRHLALQTF